MLRKSTVFLILRLGAAANAFFVSFLLINVFGTTVAALYTVNAAMLNLISSFMRLGQQTYLIKKFTISGIGFAIVMIYTSVIIIAFAIIFLTNLLFSVQISEFILLGAALHSTSTMFVAMLRKLGHDFMALLGESLVPSFIQTLLLVVGYLMSLPDEVVALGYVFSVYLALLMSFSFIFTKGYLGQIFFVRKKISYRKWIILIKVQLSQSFSFFLSALGGNIIFQYIPIHLSDIYGSAEVAAFRVASNFYNVGEVILNNMRQLIIRKAIRIKRASRESLSMLRFATRITFSITALYGLMMTVFGQQIINFLFKIDTTMTWTMMIYLIASTLISAATGFHGLVLKMTDNHWVVTIVTVLSGLALVLVILVFPASRAIGFIFQVAIFLIAQNFIFLYLAWHRLGIRTSLI